MNAAAGGGGGVGGGTGSNRLTKRPQHLLVRLLQSVMLDFRGFQEL